MTDHRELPIEEHLRRFRIYLETNTDAEAGRVAGLSETNPGASYAIWRKSVGLVREGRARPRCEHTRHQHLVAKNRDLRNILRKAKQLLSEVEP